MKKLLLLLSIVCIGQIHGQIITTIAGNGTQGYSGDGGQDTAATIYQPAGISIDNKGNIYFTNLGFAIPYCTGDGVRKINTLGVITTLVGGVASPCDLDVPKSIAFDANNNLYIGNAFGRVIYKRDTAGNLSVVAGDNTFGSSGDGGPAIQAGIGESNDIALDFLGNLYIADGNNRIRKVDTNGIITTIAGNGISGYGGDGGSATLAQLNDPTGIETDAFGNVYIADIGNHRIRKIDAAGIITTVVGTGTPGFSGDGGQATSAEIGVYDITFDNSGNMYFCDSYRIRKVNTSGIISTIVGNGIGGYSGDGGMAILAQLSGQERLALDTNKNLYFTDGNRIRKVSYCNNPITINISGTNNICGGNSTVLTANGATTYTWSSNAGSLNTNTVVVNPANTTIYTVTGVNGNCISNDTITMTVNPVININGIPSVCVGGGSTILTGNGATTYTWSLNAGGVTTNSVSLSPTVTTTYTLSGETGGCVTTQTIAVNISTPINSILPSNDYTICNVGNYSLSTMGTANSFTWMPSNLHPPTFLIPNASNGVFTYTVTGTDSLGCINSDTARITVQTCAIGISSNSNIINSISIYPNPTSDQFFVDANNTVKLIIDLYDIHGRQVFSKSVDNKSNIDVSTLDNGAYTLTIKMADRVINKKLVILR